MSSQRAQSSHLPALTPQQALLRAHSMLFYSVPLPQQTPSKNDTQRHDGAITALAYSSDGLYIASGAEDASVALWDARTGSLRLLRIHTAAGHADVISSVAFSRDSSTLASASYDGSVILWSVRSSNSSSAEPTRKRLELHPRLPVYTLAYTPDGMHLVTALRDGALEVLETATYTTQTALAGHTSVATFIIFTPDPDDSLMATGGSEHACLVWQTQHWHLRHGQGGPLRALKLRRPHGVIAAAAFAPDCTRIVTGADDGSCRIWSAVRGELLCVFGFSAHPGPVCTVAFSPDGVHVAAGCAASSVRVYDSFSKGEGEAAEGGSAGPVCEIASAHEGLPVNVVAFSRDGATLVSAGADNRVRLWDVLSGCVVGSLSLEEHVGAATLVLFSPDGDVVVSGSDGGAVCGVYPAVPCASEPWPW